MSTTITGTVTLNAAFFQEIKEAHQEFWERFSHASQICQASRCEPGREVVDALTELRDQIALHFALEEACGYFDDPQEVSPQISEQAIQLRDEHRTLYVQIVQLAEFVDSLHRTARLARHACEVEARFRQFSEQLHRHEQRENELILQVFDDVGVGD